MDTVNKSKQLVNLVHTNYDFSGSNYANTNRTRGNANGWRLEAGRGGRDHRIPLVEILQRVVYARGMTFTAIIR